MQLTQVESQKSTSTARPRNWRKLSGVEFSHTRPISGARTLPFSTLIPWLSRGWFGVFQFLPHQPGTMLDKILMFGSEGSGEVAVNIQFAHHGSVHKHGHDDLRPGLQ